MLSIIVVIGWRSAGLLGLKTDREAELIVSSHSVPLTWRHMLFEFSNLSTLRPNTPYPRCINRALVTSCIFLWIDTFPNIQTMSLSLTLSHNPFIKVISQSYHTQQKNLLFQEHTPSHPEGGPSWSCRSKGCPGDCTTVVCKGQMCETKTKRKFRALSRVMLDLGFIFYLFIF